MAPDAPTLTLAPPGGAEAGDPSMSWPAAGHFNNPLGPRSTAPRVPATTVRRPRLEALLANGATRPVTIVSAPAGAGKTTFLASWFHALESPSAAWLTLGERDNDSQTFVSSLVMALGADAARPPIPTGDDMAVCADALRQVELRREPQVLVLDDVQELETATALATLGRVVESAPSQLQLVLATRADPPLRLGRLRVEGRLREIRSDALSFQPSEAVQLFANLGLQLARRDADAIHLRTEGWAAGLRLIATALEEGADPRRLAHDDAAAASIVSGYLFSEVFDRKPEAVQRLLLRTSIVDRLTPEIVVLLADDADAAKRLADLKHGGLFLSELELEHWYRYHSLFGALLRDRLRAEDPALSRELHLRAAHWYVDQGSPAEAEHHAREAGDWE